VLRLAVRARQPDVADFGIFEVDDDLVIRITTP